MGYEKAMDLWVIFMTGKTLKGKGIREPKYFVFLPFREWGIVVVLTVTMAT